MISILQQAGSLATTIFSSVFGLSASPLGVVTSSITSVFGSLLGSLPAVSSVGSGLTFLANLIPTEFIPLVTASLGGVSESVTVDMGSMVFAILGVVMAAVVGMLLAYIGPILMLLYGVMIIVLLLIAAVPPILGGFTFDFVSMAIPIFYPVATQTVFGFFPLIITSILFIGSAGLSSPFTSIFNATPGIFLGIAVTLLLTFVIYQFWVVVTGIPNFLLQLLLSPLRVLGYIPFLGTPIIWLEIVFLLIPELIILLVPLFTIVPVLTLLTVLAITTPILLLATGGSNSLGFIIPGPSALGSSFGSLAGIVPSAAVNVGVPAVLTPLLAVPAAAITLIFAVPQGIVTGMSGALATAGIGVVGTGAAGMLTSIMNTFGSVTSSVMPILHSGAVLLGTGTSSTTMLLNTSTNNLIHDAMGALQ